MKVLDAKMTREHVYNEQVQEYESILREQDGEDQFLAKDDNVIANMHFLLHNRPLSQTKENASLHTKSTSKHTLNTMQSWPPDPSSLLAKNTHNSSDKTAHATPNKAHSADSTTASRATLGTMHSTPLIIADDDTLGTVNSLAWSAASEPTLGTVPSLGHTPAQNKDKKALEDGNSESDRSESTRAARRIGNAQNPVQLEEDSSSSGLTIQSDQLEDDDRTEKSDSEAGLTMQYLVNLGLGMCSTKLRNENEMHEAQILGTIADSAWTPAQHVQNTKGNLWDQLTTEQLIEIKLQHATAQQIDIDPGSKYGPYWLSMLDEEILQVWLKIHTKVEKLPLEDFMPRIAHVPYGELQSLRETLKTSRHTASIKAENKTPEIGTKSDHLPAPAFLITAANIQVHEDFHVNTDHSTNELRRGN